jgi:N-acetyl-gamma-glutamyl-phosphate reductase
MKPKIFIDGDAGTTGLKIRERLKHRPDLEILQIAVKKRKDLAEKKKLYDKANLVILCLPDDAAREAVLLINDRKTKIVDCSTAHRCETGWAYGLPELRKGKSRSEKYRQLIKTAQRVSVPGCYATGFTLAVNPLSSPELINPNMPIFCTAITGYSGGGKEMIKHFETFHPRNAPEICCRSKNLDGKHKHLPEMKMYSLLNNEPSFIPVVGNFYNGMLVHVSLIDHGCSFLTPEFVRIELEGVYRDEKFIKVISKEETDKIGSGFLSPTTLNETNRAEIFIFGQSGNITLVTRLDNLGKGSSGAAVQCMNLMLGIEETAGLL